MILKDYCIDWIIGWVAYWIAFMSVFFTLEKLVFKSGSTPPWYLLNTLLFVEILQLFLITFPTNPQYMVDQSRKLLPPRQILDTWWIDRASVLGSDELFLDTCSIPQLSTTISSIPTSIASSTPASIELYWRSIYTFFAIWFLFLRSFLICPHLFIS